MLTNRKLFVLFLTFVITILVAIPMLSTIYIIKAQPETESSNTVASRMLQQSNSGINRYDNNTSGNILLWKSLFFVTPIHRNAGHVLSAPTIIKPDYRDFSPPYFSASVPFVASSVVLRTLGGVPFIAVYEVSAHTGQPQVINNLTTAEIRTINNTK